MAFSDYSNTPAENTSIAGINTAEGCPAGNVNDVLRQLAADGKALSDTVSTFGSFLPIAGGTLTGDITRQGQGGYFHASSASLTDGRVDFLAEGSALPTAAAGRLVLFYS